MFKVRGAAEISLDDYFNKWGFGDGDDAVATEAGYANRNRAIRLLREEIRAVGLTIFVSDMDGGGIHNNCRIALYNGTDMHADDVMLYEGRVEVSAGLTPRQQRLLLKAYKIAGKRFDAGARGNEGSFTARGVGDTAPVARPLTARQGATLLRTLAKEDTDHAQEFKEIAALLTARPH